MSEPLTREQVVAMCRDLTNAQHHTKATFFLAHDAAQRALLRQREEEIERLKASLKMANRAIRDDIRDAAVEQSWKDRQGEDYGTY